MDCMKWKQYGRELDWKEEIRNHLKNERKYDSTRRRQREWPKKEKGQRKRTEKMDYRRRKNHSGNQRHREVTKQRVR